MRVLVTGGAGFIGSHVVEALTAAGHDVRALDCLHPAAHGTQPSIVDSELIVADVRDGDAVTRALRGVDAVVHHAAMVGMGVDLDDAPEYVGCNDLGTAVLLARMTRTGIGRLVLASSMVVYGEGAYACPQHGPSRPEPRAMADLAAGRFEPRCAQCGTALAPGLVDEDAPLDPRSVYAATKLAQEHLAAAWARTTGAGLVALRYHNVYGPRMPRDTPYAGVAAIFRSALARGAAPRVFEDGGQRRDFVHVTDVARANLAALATLAAPDVPGATDVADSPGATGPGRGPRAYNIASGEPHTIGELAAALAAVTGGPAPETTGEFRAGDVRHVVASPARARRELGFIARVTFADGIADFATAPLRT
jgi:dTDP-L-rhamnose 4-epimerase